MDNITEIVNSASTFVTMRDSILSKNKIINFDIPFSIIDLDSVNSYKINLPEKIYDHNYLYDFSDKIDSLNKALNSKIRIWTSHFDSDSYICLCFICNYMKEKDCDLYVVFSDDAYKECVSPAMLNEKKLEESAKFEKKLSVNDIKELSDEWDYIYTNKCDIRIMRDNKVKLVSDNYFDTIILDNLKSLGRVNVVTLVSKLLSNYDHLMDLVYVYLIDSLVKQDKISMVEENSSRYFDSVIEVKEN